MRRPRRLAAHRLFFPAAAVYAAVILPLSLQAMLAAPGWLPALASPLAHAHELLFGFALAVVAGYLLGPLPPRRLALLFALWLLARAGFLAAPDGLVAAAGNAGFVGLLAWQVIPKFARAAKKWRNRAIAPLLAAVSATVVGYQLAPALNGGALQRELLLSAVLLFALLMLFMGGRIIAPAVANEFQRLGRPLAARVQPRLEGILLISMAAAVLLALAAPARPLAGSAVVLAGLVAALRLARWRLWHCGGRPDVLCLGLGYAWLALGLLALGGAMVVGAAPTRALHLITVGALGSLTITVMARIQLHQAGLAPARSRLLPTLVALIGLAAVARYLGGWGLPLAAAAWSAAYLGLAWLLLGARQPTGTARGA